MYTSAEEARSCQNGPSTLSYIYIYICVFVVMGWRSFRALDQSSAHNLLQERRRKLVKRTKSTRKGHSVAEATRTLAT